jgi:iron complex outermembrane receptor protein
MKSLFTFVLALAIYSFSFAQSSITGLIRDNKQEPLPFANVVLFATADSSVVKASATELDGTFYLDNVPGGNYYLSVMAMGFNNYQTEPFAIESGSTKTFNDIAVAEQSVEMKTVEYVYVKPLVEVKPDMTVFNVENTMNATGNTALELLRKAPGVSLDNNDNVMLKGRSGVQIYIDGKPSPLDAAALAAMLKNMQSSNIEAIEIISNPSAKYDAAGTGGIINIRLKKNKNFGTNGSVNLGFAQGEVPKYNGSINLNRRVEKWNAFGNYTLSGGPRRNWMDLDRIQNGKKFFQRTRSESENLTNDFKVGADYFINSRSTIGFIASGNISDEKWSNESTTIIGPEVDYFQEEILIADVRNDGTRNNGAFNLNYMFTDTSGTTFKVDADMGMYRIRTESYQPNRYYDGNQETILNENIYRTSSPTDIDIYSVKSDYERNALKGKIGIGAKVSQVSTDNTFDFYNIEGNVDQLDSARSNNFQYTENINALYLNYSRQWSKIGLQMGARAEQTNSRGELNALVQEDEVNDTSYFNIFPNVSLSYALNPMNALSLSYSRRIDRPSYQDLNPFEFKMDELTYQKGNPFLRPQYTNNIELSHTYKYMYTTSLTVSNTEDFSTMNIYADGDASYISQTNLGFQQYGALSISAPVQVKKWLSTYVSATGYYQRTKADLDDGRKIDIDFISYNFYAQMAFILPKDWGIELSGWAAGPGLWGGTFKNSGMGSMDCGAKKTFMKGRATLKLAYTDIFHTAQWRGVSDFDGQYMDTRGGWESQQFRIDFSLRFGNQQMKVKEKKGGADDLKNRVK